MSDGVGLAFLVIAQVLLFALSTSGSMFMGIAWATLPWWIIWFPILFILICFAFIALIFVGALILAAL